jgi:GT2 family glycosyltransferase
MKPSYCSVIVPTFDRPEAVEACVQALSHLDYPQDRLEIILVDDGSRVPVRAPLDREGVKIKVLRQHNAGPAAARNFGAQCARGEILAFTDDDCAPKPQWLKELARVFRDHPIALVGGRTINGLADNPYSTASQIIVDEAYRYFFEKNSNLRFFATNNMAVSAELFRESGGFDPSFRTSEDRDFCDRWIRRGHPLVYVPEAVVDHRHDLTLTSFCRLHFRYGRGARRFHRVRAERSGDRIKPSLPYYAAVCQRMLFNPLSWNSLHMAGLVGLWQMSNVAGFLWQGRSQDL